MNEPIVIQIVPEQGSATRFSQPVAALTVAGSDSGGGAGIQADLRVFAAHGLLGTSAITAITAQNTQGVTAWEAVSESLVSAQIEAVLADLPVRAAKTGMLGRAALVRAVVKALPPLPLVVDPVMISTSGHRLLEPDAELVLIEELVARATVLTPNLHEASALSGLPFSAAPTAHLEAIRTRAPRAWIVIKGGHRLETVGDAVDLVGAPNGECYSLRAPWVDTTSTHGTGCSFSAAITSRLALGEPVLDAIVMARRYLAGALANAIPLGYGHGPVDHLFWLTRDQRPVHQ